MDGFHMFPFGFGWFGFGMLFWWLILVVIGYLVYQDAEKMGMNGALWFILVILPMVGIIFLLLYIVLREDYKKEGDDALKILKDRLARGEITPEEYRKLKEELEKT